jgi:tetratricopeptide (TPR) repeat protein
VDTETISLLQGFGYGMAQNLISSIIVEGKKLKDDKRAIDNAVLLEQHDRAKPLESRIVQRICDALRDLDLSRQRFESLIPLAADPIFGAELAQQILNDRYSPSEVVSLAVRCASLDETAGEDMERLAPILIAAIQSAIADDEHLCRTKELQFQSRITEQVAELKAETTKTQEVARQTGQSVVEALSPDIQAIHATLNATLKLLSDKTSEPEIRDRIHSDRVDQARRLLESGKSKTARQLLEELRKDIASLNPPKSLLFRIATNIGSCAIQLNDEQSAIREIELAYQLEPENPKAITNLSAIALLKKEPQKALELANRARKQSSQDSIATGNFIQALFALGRESELEQLIEREAWIKKDTNCCFAIGTNFFNQGRFADAESFFRLGLAADSSEPRLQVSLAHSLIRPVQHGLLGQPILNWKFPADIAPKLHEAEQLLSQAISTKEESEDRHFFAFAHVLRADVRRMLGDDAGAISDCNIALHENPLEESALSIKALAHLHVGQFDEAIESFKGVKSEDARRHILLPWGTAYVASKNPEKLVGLLSPYWQPSSGQPEQIRIADLLLWAYGELKNPEAADELIGELQSVWPKNPDALSAIAGYRAQEGKIDAAVGLFTEALAYASDPGRDFIALQLADIFYKKDEFAKAAELYESAADLTTDNDLSRKYLLCLYNSGPHKEALSLAKLLRGDGEPLSVVSQIEANILAEIGDPKTAQQIMERLSQLHPKNHSYRIAAAQFAMRRGHHADARILLEQIPFAEIRAEPNLLIQAAQFRAVLAMGDVLKYMYQARRVGFNVPQVHAQYVGLFLGREQVDHVSLTKTVVDGDCAVLLQVGSDRRSYTILSEIDLHPERGEISPAQAETMKLLGRKSGDKFVFGADAFGNEIECTIVEVQSKFVRAFQETIQQFPTLFPTDRTLQGIDAPYEKLRDGMFRQLDAQQERFRKLAAIYESRQATFEVLANALQCSPIDLWGMLTGGRYCAFANFSGSQEDFQTEAATASKADKLLLEFTAIFTFAQLDLLDRLKKRYNLFVTQPVLDALAEAHAKLAISKPSITVGKDGENYVRDEITAERLAANKSFLERILVFLAQHVTTVPVPSLLDTDPATDGVRDLLGPISISSLFAARAEKMPLYSDDQMLRILARNEWQIEGTSAQAILHELRSKNILTKDEHVAAVAKLFFMNFSVVLISADNLMWTFDFVHYRITEDVKKILSVFHGPLCTFESAVEVLCETTKRMWLENPLYHYKIDLLDAILDALGTNRPTNQVAQHFTQKIQLKLFLVPNAADAIVQRVHQWKERKLGRAGLIVPSHYRKE